MKEKNIIVTNECFKYSRNIHDEDIVNQIKLINNTNNILTSYCNSSTLRVSSNIGKNIEKMKVEVKRLEKDLFEKSYKKELNVMDKFLINNGDNILNKAKESFKLLKYIDYMGLIKRSMDNCELCLGKCDESNLRNNESIEIGTLKKLSYNLKEDDIYVYLANVRRYSNSFNENYYINEFINIAGLDSISKDYLKILLAIPRDSLRQWYRYSEGKRDTLSENYLKNIKRCLDYE